MAPIKVYEPEKFAIVLKKGETPLKNQAILMKIILSDSAF